MAVAGFVRYTVSFVANVCSAVDCCPQKGTCRQWSHAGAHYDIGFVWWVLCAVADKNLLLCDACPLWSHDLPLVARVSRAECQKLKIYHFSVCCVRPWLCCFWADKRGYQFQPHYFLSKGWMCVWLSSKQMHFCGSKIRSSCALLIVQKRMWSSLSCHKYCSVMFLVFQAKRLLCAGAFERAIGRQQASPLIASGKLSVVIGMGWSLRTFSAHRKLTQPPVPTVIWVMTTENELWWPRITTKKFSKVIARPQLRMFLQWKTTFLLWSPLSSKFFAVIMWPPLKNLHLCWFETNSSWFVPGIITRG